MIKVMPNSESLAHAAAEIFIQQFKRAMTRSEKFSVVLSGGHTPARTYELLAEESYQKQVDWSRVHVFWGDERCVPETDPRSNFRMATETLLSHVPIPRSQIHPIVCIQEPQVSAIQYESVLRQYFGQTPPKFDLVFLGLGEDGHTASLFPNSPALTENTKWVVPVQKANENFARITLSLELLNQTELALFLISGSNKREILKKVLDDQKSKPTLPAQLIHPIEGNLIWLVDSIEGIS